MLVAINLKESTQAQTKSLAEATKAPEGKISLMTLEMMRKDIHQRDREVEVRIARIRSKGRVMISQEGLTIEAENTVTEVENTGIEVETTKIE